MNKKTQINKNKVNEAIKGQSQEILDHLTREYKRDKDLKQNLLRLKIIMSRTYISTLIH
jgi:hypothetical protein